MPFRLDFPVCGVESDAALSAHAAASEGLPFIQITPPHATPLAIVGGGGSSKQHEQDLINWPGHIWAINQGATWLASLGRTKDVWLFSVAPTERIATYLDGVERAILASVCHPDVFKGLEGRDVRIFTACGGPASVGNSILPAAILGYQDITLFGCEGNFIEVTHIYRNDDKPDQLVIRADELDYVTTTDMFITTKHLVDVLRMFPKWKERCGGMLRAMLDNPDTWEIVALSASLRDKTCGAQTAAAMESYTPRRPPFRFSFYGIGLCTEDVCNAQAVANIKSGFPMLAELPEKNTLDLAIVGGGPSSKRSLDELVPWKGHIWALNQGAAWLSKFRTKDVWMFTVDPDEAMATEDMVRGVERAILGSSCHPKLFQLLAGKNIQMFHAREIVDENYTVLGGGPCSAGRAILQAAHCGYRTVTFFGCEGSFDETTHAYRHEYRPNQMIVKAGGREYITTPDLYITTQYLADEIRLYPKGLFEKSGGLLRAMLEYRNTWEVVAISGGLVEKLDPTATVPYIPQREMEAA